MHDDGAGGPAVKSTASGIAALLLDAWPTAHVRLAVTIEVYRSCDLGWTWRARDEAGEVVVESHRAWMTPQQVFAFLYRLFPAATIRLVDESPVSDL